MNKNIIIAILVILLVAVAGYMFLSNQTTTDGKLNTEINFLSGTTLHNGEQVQFELKDAQGAAISGQIINISYDDGSGDVQKYIITTDQNGQGFLTISGEDAGNYDITLDYSGNEKYNACSAKQTITVEDSTADESGDATTDTTTTTDTESSQSSSSNQTAASNSGASTTLYNNNGQSSYNQSNLHYDSEYNFYYDDNGIIRGGQSDGMSANEVRDAYSNAEMISEGSLQ